MWVLHSKLCMKGGILMLYKRELRFPFEPSFVAGETLNTARPLSMTRHLLLQNDMFLLFYFIFCRDAKLVVFRVDGHKGAAYVTHENTIRLRRTQMHHTNKAVIAHIDRVYLVITNHYNHYYHYNYHHYLPPVLQEGREGGGSLQLLTSSNY